MTVHKFGIDAVQTWFQRLDQQALLGEVLGPDSGAAMSVGYARYGKGGSKPVFHSYLEPKWSRKRSPRCDGCPVMYIREKGLTSPLTQNVGDSWWRETTLLYTAQTDADPIVRACLESATVPALALAFDCTDYDSELAPELREYLNKLLASAFAPETRAARERWIVRRYFDRFVPSRRDRWVFGDRESGAYLLKSSWTKITRRTLVKGWASPDDPTLTSYWAARRRRGTPPLDTARLRLLKRQQGRCPLCGELLLHADREPQHTAEWEQSITAVRAATRHQAITLDARPGTNSGPVVFRLIHTHCRDRQPDGTGSGPALLQTYP